MSKMWKEELNDIASFIRAALERDWDIHTSTYYGCKESGEEGMRQMDPKMYDLTESLRNL